MCRMVFRVLLLGPSANNLQGLFEEYPSLTHDISLPSHVANVSSLFKNCLNLEYIQSNWSNSYDLNNDNDLSNDVITEECYDGCTNVRYIDNELYMNEYGELTAIYNIPEEWGGIMNYADDETVFDVNTKYMNDRTITLQGNTGEYVTNWGDGTTDKLNYHTYTKEGTFRVVTKNDVTFGQGTVVDTALSLCITKFLHLNKNITNGSHLFDGWSNLLKIYQLENTFNSYDFMFNNCTNLMDVDLSNCTLSQTVTSVAYMCNGCAKFTKTPISVIPDTCTNISYLFANSGITDISGITFGSKISNTTSWIPPNLTTANNMTIKNNKITFEGCNNLLEVQNLTITNTVTSLFNFLRSCPRLTKFSFNKNSDLSKVTTIKGFLVHNKIISILDFSGFDLTSLDTMSASSENQGFIANTNVSYVDFSNCEFGNKKISWTWLTNNCTTQGSITFDFTNTIMPVINFNRFGWGSGNTKHYFKFNGADFKYWTTFARMFATDATHINGVDFTDAKFSHITDFSDMFNGTGLPQGNSIHITEDIVFPSTATNVERAFYGCTKLTHIHSNWDNEYDNEITSTDCYAGCTGITHRDGLDLGVNEYISGLDDVPPSWGGYGLYSDYTTIAEFDIDEANLTFDLTNVNTNLFDDKIVVWGDGAVTYGETKHTYTTTGKYVIKGKYWFGNANLSWAKRITKIIKVPYNVPITTFFNFCGATLLEYANFTNAILNNASSTFNMYGTNNNSILKTIIIKNTRVLKNANINSFFATNPALEEIDVSGFVFEGNHNIESMFDGCRNLTTIRGLETWTDGTKFNNMKRMFCGCSKLTNSEVNFGDINFSNVTSMEGMFKDCTGLTELDLSNWNTSKVGSIRGMLSNCTYLTQVNLSGWDLSSMTTCLDAFNGCTSLQTANFSNWKNMNKRSYDVRNFLYNCTSLTSVNFTGWDTSTINNFEGMFRNCSSLTSLNNIDHFDFSNATNVGHMFNGCGKIKDFNFFTNFTFPQATTISNMFNACSSMTSLDLSGCDLPNVTNVSNLLNGCKQLTSVKFPSDIAQPTDVTGMFSGTSSLMRIENCPIITRGTSGMTYMYWAYSDANANPIGQVITFATNGELGNWDTYYNKNFFKRVASETITNIANAAYDYTNEGKTITYNTNGSLAYFTDAQISIFTSKGWTLT